MQSRIVEEARMDAVLDASIREGLCACFPSDREVFARTRAWHGTLPDWTVVLQEGLRVIAHVGVVERTIHVGCELPRVAGPQNVFVLPDCRGRALCREVMRIAMAEAERRRLDFGLLFCTPQISQVYRRLGWQSLTPRAILRIDDDGRQCPIPTKNVGMFFPLMCRDFPPGDIDLQGNDW